VLRLVIGHGENRIVDERRAHQIADLGTAGSADDRAWLIGKAAARCLLSGGLVGDDGEGDRCNQPLVSYHGLRDGGSCGPTPRQAPHIRTI
jgi:hypothetical protein